VSTIIEQLKSWHVAGAQAKADMKGVKPRLKALLKIDPNPTLGEEYSSPYTSPEPVLIFRKGNFVAKLHVKAVESFLDSLQSAYKSSQAWLKENLVGKQGKVLASEEKLYLIDLLDLGRWATEGSHVIKIETKAPIPEEYSLTPQGMENLQRHMTQGDPLVTFNAQALFTLIKPFSKSDSLELEIQPETLIVRAYKGSTLEGSTMLPAESHTPKPLILKVKTKVFNHLLQHWKQVDVHLGMNDTCLTLDNEAYLFKFNDYPKYL